MKRMSIVTSLVIATMLPLISSGFKHAAAVAAEGKLVAAATATDTDLHLSERAPGVTRRPNTKIACTATDQKCDNNSDCCSGACIFRWMDRGRCK